MNSFDDAGADVLLSGRADWLGTDAWATLARYPSDAVDTEYPHAVRSVESPDDVPRPAERHPVFFGCYDWHSAVHSHWCLVRQLRLADDHPDGSAVADGIDDRLTPENVADEVAYFDDRPSFEEPYGWAWLLRLAAELHLWDDDRADAWRETLRPLETRIRELAVEEFLPRERPFRVGTHHNSAFALGCMLDYARTTDRGEFESAVVDTARRFYADDADYPVEYEPLGWDFVSPALTEADLLRRVLDGDDLRAWLDAFLPAGADSLPGPVRVDDDAGGVALHLVGLNLSRAWCLAGLADALGDCPLAAACERSARAHAERGVTEAFTDDYAGAHWLSSFVTYLLTRDEGGIAPV